MDSELLHTLALTYAKGIGDITGRKLITHFGSAENLFREIRSPLPSSSVTPALKKALSDPQLFNLAERELSFASANGIEVSSVFDHSYPFRLKECADAPLVLFRKGAASLDGPRVIAVVGTRRSTEYGKELVEGLITDLAAYNTVVVSGLAFGIDIIAHRASLSCGLSTVAVVAHGLDRIYPGQHKKYVLEMLEQDGAIVSDFPSGTNPDKENFPKRNRIIAGLADAVIVAEARETGGALITADIANSYGREVFAFPGRVNDPASKGCLRLIRNNQAALITCGADLVKAMRWDEKRSLPKQPSLFLSLTEDEDQLVTIIKTSETADIDTLSIATGWNTGKIAATLLNLELNGVIRSLPGKIYRLVG